MNFRAFGALLFASIPGACALPHGPSHGLRRFEFNSIGLAQAQSDGHARTGITLAAYNAGNSRLGSYAAVRFDSLATLNVLLDAFFRNSTDSNTGSETVLFDDYKGAFVFSMGGVFRINNELALYAGGGIGDFYEREVRTVDGRDEVHLHSLYWRGNVQSGLIWTFNRAFGLDFGYDSFDDSWRLGVAFSQ